MSFRTALSTILTIIATPITRFIMNLSVQFFRAKIVPFEWYMQEK